MPIAVVLWGLLTLTLPNELNDIPVKTIATVQQSVIPVVCLVEDSKAPGGVRIQQRRGTGFFVDKQGHFVTASHVVFDFQIIRSNKNNPCYLAIYVPTVAWHEQPATNSVRWFRFEDCVHNRDADIVVCKTGLNPFSNPSVSKNIRPLTLSSIRRLADGSPVAFTGFPLDFTVPITSQGHIAAYFPGEHLYAIDKTAWPGASGSPVYDVSGGVVGMIIRKATGAGEGIVYARSSEPILELLRTNKIPVEK